MSILHLVEIQILDKQLCMVIQYSFSFIEGPIVRHSHMQVVIHKKIYNRQVYNHWKYIYASSSVSISTR